MEILLYFVLVLALVGDVLLAILLVRSSRPQKPQGPTADDVVNAMTPVLQGETDPPEGRQRCADCPAYDDGDPPEEP